MSASEKEERVNTVIKTLGLGRCKDTIVGGGFRRGVSGGERKRVSIGHELLINPSAIFLGTSVRWSGCYEATYRISYKSVERFDDFHIQLQLLLHSLLDLSSMLPET